MVIELDDTNGEYEVAAKYMIETIFRVTHTPSELVFLNAYVDLVYNLPQSKSYVLACDLLFDSICTSLMIKTNEK